MLWGSLKIKGTEGDDGLVELRSDKFIVFLLALNK
jgi:hypothetical protein